MSLGSAVRDAESLSTYDEVERAQKNFRRKLLQTWQQMRQCTDNGSMTVYEAGTSSVRGDICFPSATVVQSDSFAQLLSETEGSLPEVIFSVGCGEGEYRKEFSLGGKMKRLSFVSYLMTLLTPAFHSNSHLRQRQGEEKKERQRGVKEMLNYKGESISRINPTIEKFLLYKKSFTEEFATALKLFTLPLLRRVTQKDNEMALCSAEGSNDADLMNYVLQEYSIHSQSTMCGLVELNIVTVRDPATGEVSLKPLDDSKPMCNQSAANSDLVDMLTRHHLPANCAHTVATSTAINLIKTKEEDRCKMESLYVHVQNHDHSSK